MTDDTRLRHLLQTAYPPIAAESRGADWPAVVAGPRRLSGTARWDLALALAAIVAVVVVPDAWFWVAYHF